TPVFSGEHPRVDRDAAAEHDTTSGSAVGAAVVAFGVASAVSGAFSTRGAVGAAVVALGIASAIGRAFS
ncbi:hypothetical protein C6A85_01115, partial [Mycobacterium sp. ITM-2017-0098]